ncbi:MAG: 50S ribosome-binding GTPase [Anaerolineales bacterium]|jgi:small GTP-binding protein
MKEKESTYGEFIGHWQQEIQKLWDGMSVGDRQQMLDAVRQIPGERKGWKGLLDRAVEQVRFATGEQRQVAIVGPANAGKSTLYNQFVRERSARSAVSAVPGTTREPRTAQAGLFLVVDTPGADAVGAVGEVERQKALAAAGEADVLVAMFDASHGIRSPEIELFRALESLDRPMVVALNKIDLIGRERATVIGKSAAALGLNSEQIIPMSALKGEGIVRVLQAAAKVEPGIAAAIGEALPEYRWDLAQVAIARAASTAAVVALTPLPFLDFFPLVGVQAAMVIGIARIYQQRMTLARSRELIATFGMGLLGRTLFYEISKLGGPPAWLVGTGVAAGTTAAIGYAATIWFERGVRVSSEAMRRIAQAVADEMLERLKSLGRKRPSRSTLRERVRQALEETDVMRGRHKQEVLLETDRGDENPAQNPEEE